MAIHIRRSELTEDWKKVLFNQFHDLAAGSGIGVIYKDAQKDYDVVRWSTNEISSGALQTLDERIKTEGSGTPVVVYNPLGWERSGEISVHVQTGKPVIFRDGSPDHRDQNGPGNRCFRCAAARSACACSRLQSGLGWDG